MSVMRKNTDITFYDDVDVANDNGVADDVRGRDGQQPRQGRTLMHRRYNFHHRTVVRKVSFTLMLCALTVVLSNLMVWGAPRSASVLFETLEGSPVSEFTSALTGGALGKWVWGSYAVTAMIMASIFMQLLSLAFPRIEKMHSDGESGRRAFEAITLRLTLVMVVVVGAMQLWSASRFEVIAWWKWVVILTQWVVAAWVLTYLAQKNTSRGIGSGMTMVLATNICAHLGVSKRPDLGSGLMSYAPLVVAALVFVAVGYMMVEKKLPLSITSKPATGLSQPPYIAIRANAGGVMPAIYAMGVLMMPHYGAMLGWSWCQAIVAWPQWVHVAAYAVLVLMFGSYSSKVAFNSHDLAYHLRHRGDTISGIGHTSVVATLEKTRKQMSRYGTLLLCIIVVAPHVFAMVAGGDMSVFVLSGTTLVIMVSVAEELLGRAWMIYFQWRSRPPSWSRHMWYYPMLLPGTPLSGMGIGRVAVIVSVRVAIYALIIALMAGVWGGFTTLVTALLY